MHCSGGCSGNDAKVTLRVTVEFHELDLKSDYKHVEKISSSKDFRKNHNDLDITASIEASYELFSGKASATYHDITDKESDLESDSKVINTTCMEFQVGTLQIKRVITNELTIDNHHAAKVVQETYVDTVPVEDDLSGEQLDERAIKEIDKMFGDDKHGNISGSRFTDYSCMKRKTGTISLWFQ